MPCLSLTHLWATRTGMPAPGIPFDDVKQLFRNFVKKISSLKQRFHIAPQTVHFHKSTHLAQSARFNRGAHPTRAELINAESRLGSTIFGPIPEGHQREFVHDRNNIWIWHEAWAEPATLNRASDRLSRPLHELLTTSVNHREFTVRYEVRPNGVFKKIAAGKYFKLEGDELENFRLATHAYLRLIKAELYS